MLLGHGQRHVDPAPDEPLIVDVVERAAKFGAMGSTILATKPRR